MSIDIDTSQPMLSVSNKYKFTVTFPGEFCGIVGPLYLLRVSVSLTVFGCASVCLYVGVCYSIALTVIYLRSNGTLGFQNSCKIYI
jgi:hypothetical protein